MPDSHDTLKAYIQKVLSIQDPQREKLPTQEELKALALEIGLDIKEWEALQKTFADHLARGKGFVKYENWDDAIEELQQAIVINPSHPGASIELAKAYQQRWRLRKKEEDLQMAEKYARICLKIDPHHDPALKLLSELKAGQTSKNKNGLIIAGVICALILSGIGFFYDANKSDSSPQETQTNMKSAPSDSPTPNASTPSSSPDAQSVNIETLNDLGIEVEFDPGKYGSNFTLLPYSSDFKPYGDAYSYKLLANLKLEGIESEEIKLQVELIDDQGGVIHTDFVNALEGHNPTARSGDLIAFGYQEYQKVSNIPSLAKARLSIHQVKALPAGASYTPSPKTEITWTPNKPSNVDLIVRKRMDRVSENILGGVFQYLAFEVQNVGNTNVKGLKFQLQWYDQNDELLESKDLFIVSSSTPPLLRGQVRVEGGTYSIKDIKPSDIKTLEIIVADIDY